MAEEKDVLDLLVLHRRVERLETFYRLNVDSKVIELELRGIIEECKNLIKLQGEKENAI